MNEENAFDDEESGTNKSRRDGVLSTDRACGSRTMNEENALDNKETGTNNSRRYGVSFLCGGFVFVLVGVVSAGALLLCRCHARANV